MASLALLCGCAAPLSQTSEAAGGDAPERETRPGRAALAASAAARTGLECLRVFASGRCHGEGCNAVMLTMAVVCPTAALVSAAAALAP